MKRSSVKYTKMVPVVIFLWTQIIVDVKKYTYQRRVYFEDVEVVTVTARGER